MKPLTQISKLLFVLIISSLIISRGSDGTTSKSRPCTDFQTDGTLSYLYSSKSCVTLSFVSDSDFKYEIWDGSGTIINGAYNQDSSFNPVFAVSQNTATSGWGNVLALNFDYSTDTNSSATGAGFTTDAEYLTFKIKNTNNIDILITGKGTEDNLSYDLSSTDSYYYNPLDDSSGWKQVHIPLSEFPNRTDNTQLAFIT